MKINKLFILVMLSGFFACTDLKENLNDDLNFDQADEVLDAGILLSGAYSGMNGVYHGAGGMWGMNEHSSDEAIAPTRGGDWDDNGAWRALCLHSWSPEQVDVVNSFNGLLGQIFATTQVLTFGPTPGQEAEAKALRALHVYNVADLFGQVPFREPGEDLLKAPRVMSADEAINLVITEAEAAIPNLPDGPATLANKDMAKVLLMKAYLNKGVYADRAAPKFDNGDMQKVITLADEIINSGKYSLATNYFDNFAPNNNVISTENIFTSENVAGSRSNIRFYWFCGLHYNQNPSGWNGFSTLSDFYDSFEAVDSRRSADYPGMTDVSGVKAGFEVGQMVDQNGTALLDRKGNPLIFTPEVKLVEAGNNLEVTGIRVMKYPIDYFHGDNADNDLVIFRYADVLLMKAEAMLRNGDAAGGLTIVNQIRAARAATALGSLDLTAMLAERGREMYWEGWRRQDLIRFGKFLNAWQEKPATDAKSLIFPIPSSALAVNPNLAQNPGY
ncbi:MAG: RagB/SusD family nutrient uptake outer membrane protein [Saprospiraceae bacterium]|nr:RagB/SusD family nutrient uptake outer membrane protein [Saprospiraceae bacterium]MCF8249956.1 RagB/SusD family nutrient uptake outer membrane protein [Saprospiraceae bacterium]MCF8279369.1 RagB/SusD family nutrient uptake outer membrane protein [Bacteroidales bacterium]MCF8310060.1 RagB/SusD family nutrient uptake outer membrane protein [Saprospiraceae bacterium]MCF8438960.1 RagB/SusD family nutrient uptake outer membrane protein [Saprospiraceae bacterium]